MRTRVPLDNFEPFDDFDTPERARRVRFILFTVLFAATVLAMAALGFAVARGGVIVPESARGFLPPDIAERLRNLSGERRLPSKLSDFEFQLARTGLPQGDALLEVQLTDKRSGSPVPNAVIFARRLDMAPEGMPSMTSPLEPQASREPGVYRFRTNLTMEGRWRLSLVAKVQGETGTVVSELILKAAP